MKIIRGNAAYVQMNDIAFLNQTDLPIPASIYMKVFGTGVVIIDDRNRYEFVKFEETDEIEFFKNLYWIVDYDLVNGFSDEDFVEVGEEMMKIKRRLFRMYNSLSEEDRKKHTHLMRECELLDFKMHSLSEFLLFKQGTLKMTLPEGVDYPEGHNNLEKKQQPIEPKKEEKDTQKIRRIFSKIRKKIIGTDNQ